MELKLTGQIRPTEYLNAGIVSQRFMRLQAIIWKEEDMFVIKEAFTGVTTQGKTIEEAMENLKEAVELYLEEMPEVAVEIENIETVGALNVEALARIYMMKNLFKFNGDSSHP